MPKFSIRHLLLGIGLFALGCGLLYVGDHIPPYTDVDMPTPGILACGFSGFLLICAGFVLVVYFIATIVKRGPVDSQSP